MTDFGLDAISRLILQIYDAGSDDEQWPAVLEALRQQWHAAGAALYFVDRKRQPVDRLFSANLPLELVKEYQDHFHRLDVRMERSIPARIDRTLTDHDLVDEALIARHPFYQDYLKRADLRYALGDLVTIDADCIGLCVWNFGWRQPLPDAAGLAAAKLLRGHLQRALQWRRQLRQAGASERVTLDLLDRLAQALILLDQQGQVVWLNSKAAALLRQADGLKISERELHAGTPGETAALHRLIRNAAQVARAPRTSAGGALSITRPSLKRAYRLLVAPLPGAARLSAGVPLPKLPAVGVFITDPAASPVPRPQLLRQLYGLTQAEARLAAALAGGVALKDYAEQSALSLHYVRWLLKQIEAKTDTRRMADLIRLLIGHAALFGENGDGG